MPGILWNKSRYLQQNFRNSCLLWKGDRHISFSYPVIKATEDLHAMDESTEGAGSPPGPGRDTDLLLDVAVEGWELFPFGPARHPQWRSHARKFPSIHLLLSPQMGRTHQKIKASVTCPLIPTHWKCRLRREMWGMEIKFTGHMMGDAATKTSLMSHKWVTHNLHVPTLQWCSHSTAVYGWPTFPPFPSPAGPRES